MMGPDGTMQEVDVSALMAGARLEAAKASAELTGSAGVPGAVDAATGSAGVPGAVDVVATELARGKESEAPLLVGHGPNAASHSKDASDILVGSRSLYFQLKFCGEYIS